MKPEIRPQKAPETPAKPLSMEEMIAAEQKIYTDRCLKFGGNDGGIVFAYIYRPHNGFANYAMVKLLLRNGKVEEVIDVSQPYYGNEVRAKMEIAMAREFEKMRVNYPGDHRHV